MTDLLTAAAALTNWQFGLFIAPFILGTAYILWAEHRAHRRLSDQHDRTHEQVLDLGQCVTDLTAEVHQRHRAQAPARRGQDLPRTSADRRLRPVDGGGQ